MVHRVRSKEACRRLEKDPSASLGMECQGGDLNSRPRAYESPALPLSYPGKPSVAEDLTFHISARKAS